MRTLHDDVQVVWISVHVVFRTVFTNCCPDLILEFGRDGMLGRVHVRNVGGF